ncbi:MAG: hypothetical protein K2L83_02555 [Muribaculaceae bacterium]|nr:hypothetical protein [Muribaculaceae bacterium]
MELTSEIFRIGQGRFLSYLFMRKGRWWWVVGGAIVAALIAVAIVLADVRYAVLALMAIFIVMPMAIAWLYFYHALTRVTSCNTLPHSLTALEEGILVTVYPSLQADAGEQSDSGQASDPEDMRKEESESGSRSGADADRENEQDDDPVAEPVCFIIPRRLLRPYTIGVSEVIVPVDPAPGFAGGGLLILPAAAFGGADRLGMFMKEIYGDSRCDKE